MTYLEAIDRRAELERTCTDPECWEELAQAFEALGAECNAAACRRRAEHYRNERDREKFIDTWRSAFEFMEQELKSGVNFAEIPYIRKDGNAA